MRMEFKGNFLYFKPTWILEDDKIIVGKKEYQFYKMKKVNLYIPQTRGGSPYISFLYDDNNELIIIDFSRKEPDFSKAKEAFQYINLKIKEYEEDVQKGIKEEEERRKQKRSEKLEEKQQREIEQRQAKEEKYKKYEIEKVKNKDKYIKIMLDKPEILHIYAKILKVNCNMFSVFNKYSDNYFKIIFWDFLLGNVSGKKFDLLYSQFLSNIHEEKEFLTLDLEKFAYCYSYNDLLKIYLQKENPGPYFLRPDSLRDLNHVETWIYAYVMLIKQLLDFYQIIDEFENNEELFQIYKNMKEAKFDNEFIVNKIYLLYKDLYVNHFKNNLNRNAIEIIIELENRKFLYKQFNSGKDISIESKLQLVNFIASELGDVSESEKIMCIANVLKAQKNMKKELKFDIILNIDDILKESKKQNEIFNLKKERDRLLKGDFSVELKRKK